MIERGRFKEQLPSKDRLSWADTIREQANQLCPSPERELLLKKARQADTASHLNEWAKSSGPPGT